MKCPNCNRKMVFNRELKDYYCEKCKKSLKALEAPEKELERPESEEEPTMVRPPEAGTVRGLLFLMIGSILQLIAPWVCQTFTMIAIFLFIFGFYIIFQDRKNHSKEHIFNMKLAAVLVVIWIVINILIIIFSYYVSNEISGDIAKYEDEDIIPNSIIVKFLEDSRPLTIISPLSIGLLAIFRYLCIKDLIQDKMKKILTISVIVLVLTGIVSMFLSLDYSEQVVSGLEDPEFAENTTKGDFKVGNFEYNESSLEPNYPMIYGVLFLNIATEAILIICLYWTFTYQRTKKMMFKDML